MKVIIREEQFNRVILKEQVFGKKKNKENVETTTPPVDKDKEFCSKFPNSVYGEKVSSNMHSSRENAVNRPFSARSRRSGDNTSAEALPQITTLALLSWKRDAMSCPRPLVPPVTTTTFPARFIQS